MVNGIKILKRIWFIKRRGWLWYKFL